MQEKPIPFMNAVAIYYFFTMIMIGALVYIAQTEEFPLLAQMVCHSIVFILFLSGCTISHFQSESQEVTKC